MTIRVAGGAVVQLNSDTVFDTYFFPALNRWQFKCADNPFEYTGELLRFCFRNTGVFTIKALRAAEERVVKKACARRIKVGKSHKWLISLV